MGRSKAIEIGGRYTMAEGSLKSFIATAVIEKPSHLPHVRLTLKGGLPNDELLVSVAALSDRKLWGRAG